MKRIPNQRHTKKFKEEAVLLALNATKIKVEAVTLTGYSERDVVWWDKKV